MSSNALTLARPYARAAFGIASEHGRLPQWSSLLGFAAAIAGHGEVVGLLGHPALDAGAKVDLLLPSGEIDPNFRRFVTVLAENGRLPLLPEIAALFEELRAEAERVVKVRLTSATPLSADDLERLAAGLRRRFDRQVEISTAVDPELLGGAVIDAGVEVIDGSLRGQLARLHTSLAA